MERILAFHRVVAPLIMEAVLFGFFSLVLFLATSLIPIAGIGLSIFTPLPLVLLSLRRGLLGGAMGFLFLFLLLNFISSLPRAVSFLLEFGGVALVLGEGIRRGWRSERAVLLATISGGVGTALLFISYMVRFRVRLSDMVGKQVVDRLQEFREVFEKMGPSPISWSMLQDFFSRSYPALLFLGILFGATLNYYVARTIRGVKKADAEKRSAPFSSWAIPDSWVWGFIFALFLYLFPDPWKRVGLNLLLAFLGLYLLQGMAIASSLLRRWHFPALLRVSIYLVSFIQPFLLLLFAGLGLFDVWLDFRKVANVIGSDEG
jgi:hypothetical protein